MLLYNDSKCIVLNENIVQHQIKCCYTVIQDVLFLSRRFTVSHKIKNKKLYALPINSSLSMEKN